MSNEIEQYRPTADSWVEVLPQVGDLATKLAQTDFVPKAMRGRPAEVAAAILTGRELGIGPMTALAHLHVIHGTPGMSAQLMRQLILAAGHHLRYVETTNARCVVEGRRRDEEEWQRVVFTADQARQAKISLGDYPEDKLVARATSRLARRLFADCLGGVPYLTDELEQPGDAPASTHTTGTRRTAQRASAARAEAPTDVPPPPSPPPAVEQDEPGPDDGGEAASGPGTPPVEQVVEEVVDAELVEDEPAPAPPPKAHGGITPAQSRMLHASFNTCGVKSRDDRMRISSAIVGRHLESSSDLTRDEAGGLIDALAQVAETEDPLARLEALVSVTAGIVTE